MTISAGEEASVALGVDGGVGTLKFAVRLADGRMIYYDCAGANPTLIGMDPFLARLGQGIRDALSHAGAHPDEVQSAGFGLSGVDRPGHAEKITHEIVTNVLKNCRKVWVGNDALAALRQGAGGLRGLVLIAGTGSICFAVAANGKEARVGGWGGDLGDEGGGFWIGLRGLQAACRMADGRLKATPLLDRIMKQFGVARPEELINWAAEQSREGFKQHCASLYPIVADQAELGDHSARQSILLGIGHLVQHAITGERHLRRLEADAAPKDKREPIVVDPAAAVTADPAQQQKVKLVCAGGLFLKDLKFYETFVFQLRRTRDVFDPVRLTDPPSLGALALGEEA